MTKKIIYGGLIKKRLEIGKREEEIRKFLKERWKDFYGY